MKYFLFLLIIFASCRTVKKSSSYHKQKVDSTVRSTTDNVQIKTDKTISTTEKSDIKEGEFKVVLEYDSTNKVAYSDTVNMGDGMLSYFKLLMANNPNKITITGNGVSNVTTKTTTNNDRKDSAIIKEKKAVTIHKENIEKVADKSVKGMSIGLKVGLWLLGLILLIGVVYRLWKKYSVTGRLVDTGLKIKKWFS